MGRLSPTTHRPGPVVATVAIAAAVTLIRVFLAINFHTPETKVEHQLAHLYGVKDSQFKREMSGKDSGNHVFWTGRSREARPMQSVDGNGLD